MDVDLKIQLQMVRDRFIDGQADLSLRRHLDSLEPNTPMIEMVDRHCGESATNGHGYGPCTYGWPSIRR